MSVQERYSAPVAPSQVPGLPGVAPSLLDALRAALGPEGVETDLDGSARSAADASGLTPTPPAALLKPRSTAEVSAVLRLCHAHRQPVVTQGGMTGLAGGAHPREGEIALSLERMNGVEEVDETAGTLTARAGTPLEAVQRAASEAGFLCGIDLGARGSCTLGGVIATNAGGNQVLRYGMARKNVLGLEAVLADGTVVTSLNKMMKNNAGFDWTQLFIGSEGTLGVVTRAVLALHPKPLGVEAALLAVPSVEAAIRALRALERRFPGGVLAFEGMWGEFIDTAGVVSGLKAPFAAAPEVVVLTEVATGDETGRGRETLAEALCVLMDDDLAQEAPVQDALVAQSDADRRRFWAYRESPYVYRERWPSFIGFDVSVPLGRMGEAVAAFRAAMAQLQPDAVHVVFGHIADSNLHVIVTGETASSFDKGAIERAIYGVVASVGGSVSAEHGIGRNKRDYLALSRTAPELALMGTIKRALDPRSILNPARVL